MKNLILFLYFICFVFSAAAQDTELPKEKVDILLQNGKEVKSVQLWAIYPKRLEYEKGGNLHDISFEKIAGILFPDGAMYLIQKGKIKAAMPANSGSGTESKKPDNASDTPPRIAEVVEEKAPEKVSLRESADDCYAGFIRGKEAANKGGTVKTAYYCSGCLPIYPLNVVYANSTFDPDHIPINANPRCYLEGYRAERRRLQTQSVILGRVTTLGVVLLTVILAAAVR